MPQQRWVVPRVVAEIKVRGPVETAVPELQPDRLVDPDADRHTPHTAETVRPDPPEPLLAREQGPTLRPAPGTRHRVYPHRQRGGLPTGAAADDQPRPLESTRRTHQAKTGKSNAESLIRTAASQPPRGRRHWGATRLGRQVLCLACAYSWLGCPDSPLAHLPRSSGLARQRAAPLMTERGYRVAAPAASCRAGDPRPRLRSRAPSIASLLAEPSSHHGDAEAAVAGGLPNRPGRAIVLPAVTAVSAKESCGWQTSGGQERKAWASGGRSQDGLL